MATLTRAFHADAERVHNEHLALRHVLHRLESALARLVCYSEVYADLATAEQVRRYGRQLAEQFPAHCQREENQVLDPVSAVSPELQEFCQEMKAEHKALLRKLATFGATLDSFENPEDLYEAVCHLKSEGMELTQNLRSHVAKEEHELSGFL